uniref:MALT paracaspase 1 n=1 Tax=Electrophorus electricus TaxID=8005 RepID=A0A4W4HFV1_ELEEL
MTTVSQDSYDNSRNINFLKESVFKRLCECLDKANNKGWRKLGETVNSERRFKVSLGDIEMCSLKVLEVEGSPSRSLLRLMGDRGCTLGDLAEFLRMMGHTEALQCLKPGIEILIQPQSVAVIAGHSIRLSCYAAGMSPVQYQWFKGKEEVPGSSSPDLQISPVQLQDAGFYICRVNCGLANVHFSQWAQVDGRLRVVTQPKPQSLLVGDALYLECGAVGRPLPHYQWYRNGVPLKNATKRKFSNHPQLKAPMVDVYDLTNLLRQLNFKVVSLLDLTESEMRNAVEEFLSLLHKGVYGLLYYAGHGYENFGNSFMVPVDAPNPYRSANCLCVQSILKLMQEKETGLNVFLLDMCRKRNFHDKDMPNVMLKVTANIVFGYATCQDAEAFELSSSGLTNGVFITFLKGRLLEDEKITVLLDRVAEDMGQFDPTKGKQALEIRSSLSERRSLTDPILPGDCSDVAQAHSLLWTKAHELPESMTLNFECGVQIKMGFAAEFSNVLIIYTSIVKKPEEMSSCQAHLINLSDLDPKMMNKQTPEETGSYLLSDSLPQHCLYTRLSSLQKLKVGCMRFKPEDEEA